MELPDKSIPGKPVKPKVTPVIPRGAAQKTARPSGRRFLDYVFSESPKHMVSKIVGDILVPRIKMGLEESANSFIHGMFWGQGGGPANGGGFTPSGMMRGTVLRGGGAAFSGMDYNSMSNPNVIAALAAGTATGPYQDLVVGSQQFAEALLASMLDLLNQYRVVSVADLYESASITPEEQHGNFGWYGLDGARIVKEREGFRLMLPKPVRI